MRLSKRIALLAVAVVLAAATAFPAEAAAFPDAQGHWAAAFLDRAVTDRYLEGFDDGTLRPNEPLTAAQIVTILARALSLPYPVSLPQEPPVQPAEWYYDAAREAVKAGLIDAGFSDYNGSMTRGRAVLMAAKGFGMTYTGSDLTLLDGFSDASGIAEADRAEVAGLVDREILQGWSDSLHLDETLTRAEFVTFLYRMKDFDETAWQAGAEQRAADRAAAKAAKEAEAARAAEEAKKLAEEARRRAEEAARVDEEENQRVTALVTSGYAGDYTYTWAEANDYQTGEKERWINLNGYSSSSEYLIWVNLTYQRANIFSGSKGNWKLIRSCIVGTGADGMGTPRGVWKVTYRDSAGWTTKAYTVRPVVGFKGGGYAFHSRLKYPGTDSLSSSSIGFPVSHGCVRMFDEDIQWVYDYIPNGTTVVVF